MENMNAIVDELIEDLDIPEDVPVMYEVWAVGYDEEDCSTGAELLIGTFEDLDEAVCFAKDTSVANILAFAEDDSYFGFDTSVYTIHVEVETTVVSDDNGTMNIGTIYKKTFELFEEVPDFVCLTNNDYTVIEETGYIEIPRRLVKEYNKGDVMVVLFEEEEEPWPIEYKIISKTDDCYICEFV